MDAKCLRIKSSDALTIKEAREILGKNLITTSQIEKTLALHSSRENGKRFMRVPFPADLLARDPRNTIVVAGAPLSILELYAMGMQADSHLFDLFDDPWFLSRSFATEEKVQSVWYCFQRRVNPGSLGKPYQESSGMLTDGQEIPRACELFYLIVLYHLIVHKSLFRGVYPFCKETSGSGDHLIVGFFPRVMDGPPDCLDIRFYTSPSLSVAEKMGITAVKRAIFLPESQQSPEPELVPA